MRLTCFLICFVVLNRSLASPQPGRTEDLLNQATEWVREGNLSKALLELQKAAVQTPDNPKVHNMLGVVLTELGRMTEANNAYSKALSIAPDFYPARKNRAVNSFSRGDLKFAASEFETLVRIEPKDFVPHLFLGLLALQGNDVPTARKHLLEARQLSPNNARVLLALTRVHFTLGERQLAVEAAREMQTKSHSTPAEQFELGVILAQFEANAEAAEVFQELWAKRPGAYDTGFNLALVSYRAGQLETALRVVDELSSHTKQRGELLNLRGWIYNKMRRLDQARESLEQAIALDRNNQEHYLDLSTILYNQGETEEAIQVIFKGIERGVEKNRLQVQMGLLHEKTGNYGEAEKWYRTAISTNSAPAYVALAHLLLGTNRRQQALELLAGAIESFPDNPFLYYLYGTELAESVQGADPQRLERAEAMLKKALERNPFYANTYYMLGRLYLKKGNDKAAQDYFEKACAFNPKHTNAHYQWLRIAVRLGEKDKATELDKIVRRLHDEEKKQTQQTVTGVVEESLRGSMEGALLTRSKN